MKEEVPRRIYNNSGKEGVKIRFPEEANVLRKLGEVLLIVRVDMRKLQEHMPVGEHLFEIAFLVGEAGDHSSEDATELDGTPVNV